jgi:hypothetical protein
MDKDDCFFTAIKQQVVDTPQLLSINGVEDEEWFVMRLESLVALGYDIEFLI